LQLAIKHKIKIYTIGIEGQGLDAYPLKKIARDTNGAYFSANDKDTLIKVYKKIDVLEKSKIDINDFVKKDYLFQYPLFIAIIALMFLILIWHKQ